MSLSTSNAYTQNLQLESTTQRLRDVEKVLLKLALSKNLLENPEDFDDNYEKIRPPPAEAAAPDLQLEV